MIRRELKTKKLWILLLTVMAFLMHGTKPAYAGYLRVDFLDVGQADAALAICDGHAMLIDGGDADSSQLIYAYLKDNNITYLDYIVCSHGDSDHIGGIPAAVTLLGFNIGKVLAPYRYSERERFIKLRKKLAEYGLTVTIPEVGSTYRLGSARFQILSTTYGGEDANLVFRLSYGNTSFLFTGDAGEMIEKQILESGYNIESTVLKVGHHGSKTSTGYQFLKAVNPKYAVIEVGKNNAYGHPADEVLTKLRDCDTIILRTDNNGDITLISDGSKLMVETEKEVSQEENLIPGSFVKPEEQTVTQNQ